MSYVLSIVIPVFNKYNFTKSCLNDLFKLPLDHEIIVVDNASSDETQEELLKITNPNFVYIRNDTNTGFGAAVSKGIRSAKAPNIMTLNNDIRVHSNHSDWTQEIIKHAPLGLVGPTMGQLDNNLNFVKESNSKLDGLSYMSGWCLTTSREIWNKLDITGNGDYFDKSYFAYFEDTQLSFVARELGIPFYVVNVPVVHFGKITSKQINTAKLYLESRAVFIKKWSKIFKK